mgnify:FL=1|tara:strand:+ start:1905 stop:2816 length:912 start_codon:yes stop_codon:yes gene_type:complete
MDIKSKIILISGPTASGKTEFAIKLAKKIKGEIINADSMQVYNQLRILTARPSKKDEKKINHYLYGFLNVKKKFSTGSWLKEALKKIKYIQKKNKIPILVGGTGLYFKALTDGLVKIPNIPLNFRIKIRNLQKRIGQKKFYKKLISLDKYIKDKIDPNDVQRSIRAYEIRKYTKKSIIEWFNKTKPIFDNSIFIKYYIDFPRDKLLKKINRRVEEMFKLGVIKEVKKFNSLKVRKENSASKVIGIRELNEMIIGKSSLEETKEKIAIKTRQYAKRQTTWARGHMKSWQSIEPKSINSVLKKFK